MPPLLAQLLRSDTLVEHARQSAGLADFGNASFCEGLEALLRACADEAELSLFGYFATRWDVCRFLTNLLRLNHEELQAPEILRQPIERPLFITGMPRSGTTFLHRLLTADKANRAPRVWELIHPYPPLGDRSRRDRRRRLVARQLRMFEILAPQFRSMHPIDADSPQECSEITAHMFASSRFDTTYSIPGYRHWLADKGHLEAYRFHKRFLQHLQHQQPRPSRWVLKCPDHIFALDELRAVYPDARVVFVHRDPVDALPSVTRLTEILRKPFTRRIDRLVIGRHESEHWRVATQLMIRAADAEPFAEPIFHVRYRDLVSNPLATVKSLYRHFGEVLGADAQSCIDEMVGEAPNGGYGRNRFDFAMYGIDPTSLRSQFAPYTTRFGIVAAAPRSANRRTIEVAPQPG